MTFSPLSEVDYLDYTTEGQAADKEVTVSSRIAWLERGRSTTLRTAKMPGDRRQETGDRRQETGYCQWRKKSARVQDAGPNVSH